MIEYTDQGVFIPLDDAPLDGLPVKTSTYGGRQSPKAPTVDYERGVTSLEAAEALLVNATRIVRWHRAEAERKRRAEVAANTAENRRLMEVMAENVPDADLAVLERLDPLFLDRLAVALRADTRTSIRVTPEDTTP